MTVGEEGKSVCVVIHAVPETEVFKVSRFQVGKNNVRPKWFYQQEQSGQESNVEEEGK